MYLVPRSQLRCTHPSSRPVHQLTAHLQHPNLPRRHQGPQQVVQDVGGNAEDVLKTLPRDARAGIWRLASPTASRRGLLGGDAPTSLGISAWSIYWGRRTIPGRLVFSFVPPCRSCPMASSWPDHWTRCVPGQVGSNARRTAAILTGGMERLPARQRAGRGRKLGEVGATLTSFHAPDFAASVIGWGGKSPGNR